MSEGEKEFGQVDGIKGKIVKVSGKDNDIKKIRGTFM
jgi:hypothetical protein